MATHHGQSQSGIPSNLNIPEPKPWTHEPPNQDVDAPAAHRQRRFYPLQGINAPLDFNTLGQRYHQQDTLTRKSDPVFTWPRLILYAHLAVLARYQDFADDRQDRSFDPSTIASRTIDDLPQGSIIRTTYQGLSNFIELLYAENLMDVHLLDEKPTTAGDIDRVVRLGQPMGRLQMMLHTLPSQLYRAEHRDRIMRDGGLLPEFRWMESFQNSLLDGICGIEAASTWANEPMTRRDISQAIAEAVHNVPEMTRLVAFLIEREDVLAKVLADEHIFGCLCDKQINLLSSYQLAELFQHFLIDKDDRDDEGADEGVALQLFPIEPYGYCWRYIYDHLTTLYSDMSTFQGHLRNVFNYVRLIEWAYKPLWNKLYITISPDLGISEDTVKEYLAWTTNSHAAANMFGITPLICGQFQDEKCVICFEDLNDSFTDAAPIHGSYIVELHCSHRFHPTCVLPQWDGENRYTNRCPLCRHPAGAVKDLIPTADCQRVDTDYELNATPADRGRSDLDSARSEAVVDRHTDIIGGDVTQSLTGFSDEVLDAWFKPALYQYLGWKRNTRQQWRTFTLTSNFGL